MLPDEKATGEAGAVETATPTASEAVVSSPDTAPEPERNFEAEARDMGWFPEAEFKGKKRPAEFLDAKTFVERGEHVLPMLKREREKLEKDFGDRFAKLEKMSDKTIAQLRKDHAKEIEALQTAKDAAIEKGDIAGVRKIDKDIATAEANAPDAPEPKEATAKTPEEIFLKDNPWFGEDEDMADLATGYSQRLLKNEPKLTLEENLTRTAKYMREKYPLKTNTKTDANGHAPVDGGSLNPGAPAKDPLASLPAEARAQAKKDMETFPKQYPNAAAWIKAYNS